MNNIPKEKQELIHAFDDLRKSVWERAEEMGYSWEQVIAFLWTFILETHIIAGVSEERFNEILEETRIKFCDLRKIQMEVIQKK